MNGQHQFLIWKCPWIRPVKLHNFYIKTLLKYLKYRTQVIPSDWLLPSCMTRPLTFSGILPLKLSSIRRLTSWHHFLFWSTFLACNYISYGITGLQLLKPITWKLNRIICILFLIIFTIYDYMVNILLSQNGAFYIFCNNFCNTCTLYLQYTLSLMVIKGDDPKAEKQKYNIQTSKITILWNSDLLKL